MKLIVCVDERNGMAFNRRRQSSDRILCEKICNFTKGNVLWMNSYSAVMFADTMDDIHITEDFPDKAKGSDYWFVENRDIEPYLSYANEVVLYRWNRRYPADLCFPMEKLESMRLISREEFSGHSHPSITQEVYRR